MKKTGNILLSVLLILLLLFFGRESLTSYLATHTYYMDMLSSGTNRGIFISVLICSFFPVLYLLFARHFKFKKLMIFLAVGLAIYGLLHSRFKGGTVGFGRFITMFNTLFLFALGAYTLAGFFALGSWIEKKWLHFKQQRRQELLLTLGIGTITFLVLVQILLGIGILYGIISRLLFLGLGFFIFWEKERLKSWGAYLTQLLGGIKEKLSNNAPRLIALTVLLVISVMYFYYGFQNSFIPYSTARDANHEYMYTPKIFAENAGIYRGNTVGAGMSGIWHMFITFFFSLTGMTNGRLGLAPDTIAVSMNFLSAVLVLLFGIALVYQITELLPIFFSHKKETTDIKEGKTAPMAIGVGRTILLLWLTSGMGAFLVMVDNKTDLGVMALSLLALLAGMIFLGILQQQKSERKEIFRYLIIAGIFFAFATLAKPTAFVDLALFGVFLIGLWISPRSAIGVGLGLAGILRYMNILTSSFLLSETNAKRLIIIGGILVLVGSIIALIKRKKIGIFIGYLLVLGISFLVPLVLFKAPWIIRQQMANDTFSPKNVVKSLFAKAPLSAEITLLAQMNGEVGNDGSEVNLEEQNLIDALTVQQQATALPQSSAQQCLQAGNIRSEEELQEDLQEVKGSGLSEDVGRYIGYGRKEFTREKNNVYPFIKLFFPTSQHCYGLNKEAKLLCANSEAIDNFEIQKLQSLYEQLEDKTSQAAVLLQDALTAFNEHTGNVNAAYNPQEFRDYIVALRQYYQSHSIKSSENLLAIPYRYIIPLNIVFNWSLQNLSSYYTDIGFARTLLFIILIITLPYALVKRDTMLIALSATTLIGRGLRWIIGGAILWYGTALISRTLISILAFTYRWYEEAEIAQRPQAINVAMLLIGIVMLGMCIQLVLNFFRISSQGANGPFVWYKGNIGKETQFSDTLEAKTKTKYGYTMKEVFNLQFPQYNPIINALKDRKNEDGIVIAGTYIQYFLANQWNLQGDGMLTEFWVKASDGNLCKTYRRLKNDNIKYLIIDPNIGTVGMGEGNETLFHRFFAKLNTISGTIEEDGTLTTLAKMYQLGYLKLFSTNNIGAYYAFNLDDQTLQNAFGTRDAEGLTLLRAKLIGIRYFPEEANTLFNQIGNLFIQRILAGQGLEEIASILGSEADLENIYAILPQVIKGDSSGIKNLSQAEKTILIQYLNLYQSFANNNSQGQEILQNLLMNSIGSSSQVMAFEIV